MELGVDVVEGSSVGDDDGGGDDVVVEVSRKGTKPEDGVPVGVGVVMRVVVTVDGMPGVVVMVEAMVEVMVEVVEETRNGVRPVVGGAPVVLLERRYGSRPEVDGELVVVVRSLSLKGKIPFGPGVVVTTSCLLYLFLMTEAVAAGSQTGQLRPVSRQ